jgi:hypothetical protein
MLSENREPTAEKPFWPFFPLIFVKYNQYSPQISEKNGLIWLSLATTPILGQPPRRLSENQTPTGIFPATGKLPQKTVMAAYNASSSLQVSPMNNNWMRLFWPKNDAVSTTEKALSGLAALGGIGLVMWVSSLYLAPQDLP